MNIKIKAILLIFAAAFGLALTSCGGSQFKDALMQGAGWVLVEMQGTAPLGREQLPTLRFREMQASGTAGCNNWIGSYELDGADIQIHEIEKTEEYCDTPAGIMEQENAYVQMLEAAERFELQGETLIIFTSGGKSLIFKQTGN